jgi:hypothetical protein
MDKGALLSFSTQSDSNYYGAKKVTGMPSFHKGGRGKVMKERSDPKIEVFFK